MYSISDCLQSSKRQKKSNVETPASEDLSHILGIVSSLLSNLPSESPNRIRFLAKFVEEDYEKVDKLIELRDGARKRLNLTEAEVEADRQVFITPFLRTRSNKFYSFKGHFGFRRWWRIILGCWRQFLYATPWWGPIHVSNGRLYPGMADYGGWWRESYWSFLDTSLNLLHAQIRTHALRMLDRRNQSLQDIIRTLRLTFEHIDDEAEKADNSISHKDILQGLISALGTPQGWKCHTKQND